ncbi:MAG: hypothetical protein KAS64_06515 [Spirochaetes bacterium]|nr:hypothetical protein [Spirochaetota bacterium]
MKHSALLVALIYINVLFISCASQVTPTDTQIIRLITISGGTISDLAVNDININIIPGSSTGGASLYFLSDRNSANTVYKSDLQSTGLFTDPGAVTIVGLAPEEVDTFSVYAQNASSAHAIFYGIKSNNEISYHVIGGAGSYAVNNTGAARLAGTVLGIIPSGGKYQAFQIGINNIGLVICQSNKLHVYEYALSSIVAEANPLNAVNQYTDFLQNITANYGGGSWFPGSIIGMIQTDGFLYGGLLNGNYEIFLTDFVSQNIPITRFNRDGHDLSPYFSQLDNKLYMASSSYSSNFNLYRWNSTALSSTDGFLLDLIPPVLIVESPVPVDNGNNDIDWPIYGRAEDLGSGIDKVFITWYLSSGGPTNVIIAGTGSIWSNSFRPSGGITIDVAIYTKDKAGNYSTTNFYTNIWTC